MRIIEVQTREKVPTGAPGFDTSRLTSTPGTGQQHGWSLDFEGGIVTATRGDYVLLVPVGNVAYMRPAPVEAKKPVKAA